ncbi:MAG: NACHT domain-containing protein [Anaerolineae bacterium]|nr:NACHT domain-containing protein [Anaerolineae bacterium]
MEIGDVILKLLSNFGIPGLVFTIVMLVNQSVWLAFVLALVSWVVTALIPMVLNVAGLLNPEFSKQWAENIRADFQQWTNRYYRKYRQHVLDRFHNIDLSGIGLSTFHNIEQENVFVELQIDRQAPTDAEGSIVPKPRREKGSTTTPSTQTIWWVLKSFQRIVIIGRPGSGKTTLLTHIAVTMFTPKSRNIAKMRSLLPIFIPFREYAIDILGSQDCTLLQIAEKVIAKCGEALPPQWLLRQLRNGKCIIMLDGLDEVQRDEDRLVVIQWVDAQMSDVKYSRNYFIITSRPGGIEKNQSQQIQTNVEVLPFSLTQQTVFAERWFLINELKRENLPRAKQDQKRVQLQAAELTENFLNDVRGSEAFSEFAGNPLLLTMMAMVYHRDRTLPENRAELYGKICQALLGERWAARGLKLPLKPDQAQFVLQPAAYHMMMQGQLKISADDMLAIIHEPLKKVNADLAADRDFLQAFETTTGLFVEVNPAEYEFAHKTFQEFLAAKYAQENGKIDAVLAAFCTEPTKVWWDETLRLYSALEDATPIVETCLAVKPISSPVLALALQCEQIAKRIEASVRSRLRDLTERIIQDHRALGWRAAAEVSLLLHLKKVTSVRDNTQMIKGMITHAEYQLFIDDMLTNGEHVQPDHWRSQHIFPTGQANEPIFGVSPNAAYVFGRWVTNWMERQFGKEYRYRLPHRDDYPTNMIGCFWVQDATEIRLYADRLIPSSRSLWTLVQASYSCARDRALASASASALASALARDGASALALALLNGILLLLVTIANRAGDEENEQMLAFRKFVADWITQQRQADQGAINSLAKRRVSDQDSEYIEQLRQLVRLWDDSLAGLAAFEQRINGQDKPIEGILLVRERVKEAD